MDEMNNTTVETTEETETSYYEDRPTFGSRIVRAGATIVIWEGIKFGAGKLMNKLGWRKKDKDEGKLVKKEKSKKETKQSKDSESTDAED